MATAKTTAATVSCVSAVEIHPTAISETTATASTTASTTTTAVHTRVSQLS